MRKFEQRSASLSLEKEELFQTIKIKDEEINKFKIQVTSQNTLLQNSDSLQFEMEDNERDNDTTFDKLDYTQDS